VESAGIILTNAVHVTNVIGDTDLDLIVPQDQQNLWLQDHSHFVNVDNASPKITLPEPQQQRYSKQFARFRKHPLFENATFLLKEYISKCIISPKLTEYSFWAVSCMPRTNVNTWPRLFCINVGVMELFVTGWDKSNPNEMWSLINVAEDTLKMSWPSLNDLKKDFPYLEFVHRNYRDAGQHQISLHSNSLNCTKELLCDPRISQSAAVLALRVMRKRATIYGKFHCPQLANFAVAN
jgi:hypothetical protein